MKKKLYIHKIAVFFVLPFLFLILSTTAGAVPSVEETLEGLSIRYQGLKSISAAYTRTTVTPATDKIFKSQASQTAEGVLFWQNPASLKLDQKLPEPELLVTDGLTVWWFVPSEKEVHLYKNLDLAGEMAPLLTFLSGIEELKKHFNIKEVKGEAMRSGEIGLVLESRVKGDAQGFLTVFCDKDFRLTGFRISSVTGEYTDFYFREIIDNPNFDEKYFTFKTPKGVRVTEESGDN